MLDSYHSFLTARQFLRPTTFTLASLENISSIANYISSIAICISSIASYISIIASCISSIESCISSIGSYHSFLTPLQFLRPTTFTLASLSNISASFWNFLPQKVGV